MRKKAEAGGYLDEFEKMYSAGVTDGPPPAIYRPVDVSYDEIEWPFYRTKYAKDGEKIPGDFHGGADLTVKVGTEVRSAFNGKVITAGNKGDNSYGKYIVVECTLNGVTYHVYYGHLSKTDYFKEGDYVNAGGIIAKSGNTGHSEGPHLHFEIRRHPYKQFDKIKSDGGKKAKNIKQIYVYDPRILFPPEKP